jgi:hypothetical protein
MHLPRLQLLARILAEPVQQYDNRLRLAFRMHDPVLVFAGSVRFERCMPRSAAAHEGKDKCASR